MNLVLFLALKYQVELFEPLLEGYFEVNGDRAHQILDTQQLYQIIPLLILTLLCGYAYELCGRRLTIFFMLIGLGLAVSLMPRTAPSVPAYYALSSTSNTLFCCLLFTPLVADFVELDCMGKAMALQVMGMNTGLVVTQLVFIYFYSAASSTADTAWAIVGSTVGLLAIVSLFMIREPIDLCVDGQFLYFFEKEASLWLQFRILVRRLKKAVWGNTAALMILLLLSLLIDGPTSTSEEYMVPWLR